MSRNGDIWGDPFARPAFNGLKRVASGPTGDVTIAVQDFETGGDGAKTLSVTTSALGGATPKAVMVLSTGQLIVNDPSETNNALISLGVRTSAEQRYVLALSENASPASNSANQSGDGYILRNITSSSGTSVVRGTSSSLVADGIEIGLITNSSDRRGAIVAFAGDDSSADAGTISLGTGTSAITTTVGFEADVVLLFGVNVVADSGNRSGFAITIGIAVNDGSATQRCISMCEADNDAAGGNPKQAILTGVASQQINPADGSDAYRVVVDNFTSTSFDVTPNASAGNDGLIYLALNFGGRQFALKDFTTPTSTGNQSITGVGFHPQIALLFLTSLEGVDPSFPLATSDLMSALTISAIGDEQWSGTIRMDSGADPTEAASNMQNKAIQGSNATSTAAILATLVSFDSDGMTLNYTAVEGTAKKGFALFIE